LPKKTLIAIKESGNHFLIANKRNQAKLNDLITEVIDNNTPMDTYELEERSRGRLENRHTSIYAAPNLGRQNGWQSIQQVFKVVRSGKRRKINKKTKKAYGGSVPYQETTYYISSYVFTSALQAHKLVREHWTIENGLHYVKDVVYKEDKSKISDGRMAIAKTTLYNIAINLYRVNGFKSITNAQIRYGNKIDKLYQLAQHIII